MVYCSTPCTETVSYLLMPFPTWCSQTWTGSLTGELTRTGYPYTDHDIGVPATGELTPPPPHSRLPCSDVIRYPNLGIGTQVSELRYPNLGIGTQVSEPRYRNSGI